METARQSRGYLMPVNLSTLISRKIPSRVPGGETLVVFVTTRSNPKPGKTQIRVARKLELQYEWKTDKWVLATIRNLTVRYTIAGPA